MALQRPRPAESTQSDDAIADLTATQKMRELDAMLDSSPDEGKPQQAAALILSLRLHPVRRAQAGLGHVFRLHSTVLVEQMRACKGGHWRHWSRRKQRRHCAIEPRRNRDGP